MMIILMIENLSRTTVFQNTAIPFRYYVLSPQIPGFNSCGSRVLYTATPRCENINFNGHDTGTSGIFRFGVNLRVVVDPFCGRCVDRNINRTDILPSISPRVRSNLIY